MMPINEQTIRATAKMYEIRDTMKRLLGEKYPIRMQQWGTIIKMNARKHDETKLDAMMRLSKKEPDAALALIAAYVELVEMGHAD